MTKRLAWLILKQCLHYKTFFSWTRNKVYSIYHHQQSSFSRMILIAGQGYYPKLPSVSPRGSTWVEDWVDMGRQWDNLINVRCFCHRARQLLWLQVPESTFLRERPCHCWSRAWCLPPKHDRCLLPRWPSFFLHYQSCQFIFIFWSYSWKLRHECIRPCASKSHSMGTRSWLHLWLTRGCWSHSLFRNWRQKTGSSFQ